jgi:uncharacterized protein YndB with AHSA1/START domain
LSSPPLGWLTWQITGKWLNAQRGDWEARLDRLDARPGGAFSVVMASPGGQEMDESPGCILIAGPQKRLVWTDGLGPEFRPKGQAFMTADITMRSSAGGTLYRVVVRHTMDADRKKHSAGADAMTARPCRVRQAFTHPEFS